MKIQMHKVSVVAALCLIAPFGHSQTQTLQSWMSPEVKEAWASVYQGQGTTITVVDDFNSSSKYSGNFNGTTEYQQHGKWTSEQSGLIAPSATINRHDFSNSNAVSLANSGLNIVNLSYGMYAKSTYKLNQIGWSAREQSIINYASGSAVISKAAGNDAVAVGASVKGSTDYLNLALVGKNSAIFVGALDRNGSPTNRAMLATYSNYAGSNTAVQSKFLVVGVTGGNDPSKPLYGTSFAAPIISGYASILGSKFSTADATKISNQLLNTARTDTIANYSKSVYGRGEASITRALAPAAIQ